MRTVLIILVLTVASVAQETKYACNEADKVLVNAYFKNESENEALAAQIRKARRTPVPFCWHGCVVRLPKPTFPAAAKNVRLSGTVTIYTIADETGRVFYAKPVTGKRLFRRSAQEAACAAKFDVIMYDNKPIKFPWPIRYNFIN